MAAPWKNLSPTAKKVVAVAVTVDTALKAVALADLAKRDATQVRGSKKVWGVALGLVNSLGVLPTLYFLRGRLPKTTTVEVIEP